MGAEAHQLEGFRSHETIDQHQIRLHVAVAVTGPVAGECVGAQPRREGAIRGQFGQHGRLVGWNDGSWRPFISAVAMPPAALSLAIGSRKSSF